MKTKLIAITLAITLALPTVAEESPPIEAAAIPALAAAGQFVIRFVVTGAVMYVLLPVCMWLYPNPNSQKPPPRVPPPAVPDEDDGEDTAPPIIVAYHVPPEYCGLSPASWFRPAPVGATIVVNTTAETPSIAGLAVTPTHQLIPREEWLTLTGIQPSHTPTVASNSPVEMSWNGRSWDILGTNTVAVTLQASTDLVAWETLVTTSVPRGTPFAFVDVSEAGHKFYRLR